MRLHRKNGAEVLLDVQVPDDDGAIFASVDGGEPILLDPEAVSRLRAMWAQAQAQALQDRGRW